MTSLLQTITIVNFIMEFLSSFTDQDVGQSQLKIDPLPFDMIHNAWLTMTIEAGYLIMGGGFPRLDILLHIMA